MQTFQDYITNVKALVKPADKSDTSGTYLIPLSSQSNSSDSQPKPSEISTATNQTTKLKKAVPSAVTVS
jgi:hypothetical protein